MSLLNQSVKPLRLGTARAALGSGLAEVVARVLAIVLAIVSARTLEPRQVGLLGLAVIVIGVISMIGYYPETAAVAVRAEGDANSHALVAMIVRSVLVVALLAVLAVAFPMVAHYLVGGPNGATELRQLMLVLLWAPIVECLSGYPQVILQRRLDLRFLACVQIIQAVVFVGLATILLVQGKGYVAVAWASLIGTAAAFVALWARTLGRGWFRFEGWPAAALWREPLLGSSRVFFGGFGGSLGTRLDNLLVAGAMGPAIMSYYSTAWTA